MKGLVYVLIIASFVTLVLSAITKFSSIHMIGGVGPTGFLYSTMVFLLFGANFALLDLLKDNK